MDFNSIETFVKTTAADLAVKVLAAVLFWFIGRWLIHRVIALVQATMHRNAVDPTLTRYLGSIISVALNIALVLGILGYFGIQTTSIAAMLAGAGVAIGAAWSGMLGNFAAGAFMLVLQAVQGRRLRQHRRHHRHRARARPVRHDASSRPTTCSRWSATARSSATRSRTSRH